MTASLLKQAVNERWGVTVEVRQRILNRILDFLDDPNINPNVASNLIRSVIQMDIVNVRREELVVKSQPKHVIVHKGNMTMEQLEAAIMERIGELDLTTIPQSMGAAIHSLQEHLTSGKIKQIESEVLNENLK